MERLHAFDPRTGEGAFGEVLDEYRAADVVRVAHGGGKREIEVVAMESREGPLVEGTLPPDLPSGEEAESVEGYDGRILRIRGADAARVPSAPHMLYVVGPHVAAAGIPARHPPEFEDAARESDDARLRSAELRGELPAPAFRQEPDIFVYETEQIVTGAGGALVVHFAQPPAAAAVVEGDEFERDADRAGDVAFECGGGFGIDGTADDRVHGPYFLM